LLLIGRRDGDRVAGVTQLFELDALDHASAMDVETRDDTDGKHGGLEG
jgi:hypothetical protein